MRKRPGVVCFHGRVNVEWDVSPVAWSRLYHARVSYLLVAAGIDHVLIKGQTWAGPLHLPDARVGDVDVLVPPAQMRAALDRLLDAGLSLAHGTDSRIEVAVHSVTLRSTEGTEVDLHDRYPGLDADPDLTWRALMSHVGRAEIAGYDVPVLDGAAQALVAAASAARDGAASTSARRVRAGFDGIDWPGVASLADEVGAGGVLHAAFQLVGRGAEARALQLPPIPVEWRLALAGAANETKRAYYLLHAPTRDRWRMLAREVLPTRAFLAVEDPELLRKGPLALVTAHLRRWHRIARRLPEVVRTLWRVRRDTL